VTRSALVIMLMILVRNFAKIEITRSKKGKDSRSHG
jgi:hypothetical protein